MRLRNKGSVLVILILLTIVIAPFASGQVVVSNSKDWKELYTGFYYAANIEYKYIYFKSLYDSKIKTQTFGLDEQIIILESEQKPVVKNYANLLEVKGYTNVETIKFTDYSDLQAQIMNILDKDKIVVLDPRFGIETITSTPYMLLNDFFPLFIDKQNQQQIESIAKKASEVIIVGHHPIRTIENLKGEFITGFPEENAHTMTAKLFEQQTFNWGSIVNAKKIDLESLQGKIPIFVYNDDIKKTGSAVKNSGINNFEVIGAEMADISKAIESESERDLKLILKYAQTYTNVEGLTGRILDLDRIDVPAPTVFLEIVEVIYYPEMNTIVLSLKNTGNINAEFFTNFEFEDIAFSDERVHTVLPGQTITIPYIIENQENIPENIIVSTVYGLSQPLTKTILSEEGLPSVETNIQVNNKIDESKIGIERASFDDDKGEFYIEVSNPEKEEVTVIIEIILEDGTIISQTEIIGRQSTKEIVLDAPYIPRNTVIGGLYNINIYYGEQTKIDKIENFSNVLIEKHSRLDFRIIIIIILSIILLLILFLFFKRRRKKKKEEQNEVNKG